MHEFEQNRQDENCVKMGSDIVIRLTGCVNTVHDCTLGIGKCIHGGRWRSDGCAAT